MKKIAIAVAAAMTAAAAGAANVEIYGIVDTGLGYTNKDTLAGTTETFEMINGYTAGSRVGFKGKEDLGNGYAVSFILENGFASDAGTLGQDGRMFGRESQVKFHTPYGTMSFGRAGTLMSGAGSQEIFGTYADAIPGGWDGIFNAANYQGNAMRRDNMVTYVSPTAAGFTAHAQYSFANDTVKAKDTDSVSNPRETNRYVALGLTYANGPVQAVVVYDTLMYKHETGAAAVDNIGDNRNLSVGGSYDFGFMRVSAYGQYVKGARDAYLIDVKALNLPKTYDADGYNFGLGVLVPTDFGRFTVAGYYGKLDVNDDAENSEAENFNVMLTHEYDLSKRTTIYSGLAYRQVKCEGDVVKLVDDKTTQVVLGLRHAF